jgi:hypothetical protein
MLGLSGKEETVRINHLPKKRALCRTQTNVEKWIFEISQQLAQAKYSFILSDSRIQIALERILKLLIAQR